MDDLPRKKLKELVGRFGRDVAGDARQCEALLRDMCPQHKREIFVLVSAVKESVPVELLGSSSGMPKEVLLARLSKRLHENLGVAENLTRWAVESWALALGIASTKDFRFPFKCPACSAAGSMASRLAGQTVQCPKCKASVRISADGGKTSIESPTDQSVRMQSSLETVVAQASTVTMGTAAPPAEYDLFSEFPRVSVEDMLRQTIRRVLADGIVTDEERAEVHGLRTSLGITSDVAARILSEVKAEMGIGEPAQTATEVQPATANVVNTAPVNPQVQTTATPPPVSQGSGKGRRALLIGVPVSLCLLIYWLGWKTFFVVVLWIFAVPSGLIAIGCGIGALTAKAEAKKKKELWQITSGLAVGAYVLLKLAVWLAH